MSDSKMPQVTLTTGAFKDLLDELSYQISTAKTFEETLGALPIPTGNINNNVTMNDPTYNFTVSDKEKLPTGFPNLPQELQVKILGHALPVRIVTAKEKVKVKSAEQHDFERLVSKFRETDQWGENDEIEAAYHPSMEYSTFEYEGAKMPTVFAVCKNNLSLRYLLGYKLMFKNYGSNKKALYFNPQVDIFKLDVGLYRDPLCDWKLGASLMDSFDLTLIQELVIPLPILEQIYENVMIIINGMTNLQVLHIYGEHPVTSACPQITLNLDFKTMEDDKGRYFARTTSISGCAEIASNGTKSKITTYCPAEDQKDRLEWIERLLEFMMTFRQPFPQLVKLHMVYFLGNFALTPTDVAPIATAPAGVTQSAVGQSAVGQTAVGQIAVDQLPATTIAVEDDDIEGGSKDFEESAAIDAFA